jgi:hypothetical protein
MRAKPYCNIGIIVMADKAIMPTDARTPSRWHVSIEPVEVFDYHNRVDFIAACKRAISRGIPEVPMPSEKEMYWDEQGPAMKEPITLKYAHVSTWDELERNSIYVTIECYDRGFLIESWGRAKGGKWGDQVLELRLEPEAGIEGAVDAVLEHLKTRADLPGMIFDVTRKTAKGA